LFFLCILIVIKLKKNHLITSLIRPVINLVFGGTSLLITTIFKDGEFSVEFRKEITDLVPAISCLSHQNFVQLVGVANIDDVLKYI
jgi:hypothetical protein